MRLPFAVAFAAIVFLATAASARGDQTALERARQQTFVVQVAFDDVHGDIGAGVVVARDADVLTIATAAHLLQHKGTLQILDTTRRDYYQVLGVDTFSDYDLALIRVRAQPANDVQPVQMAEPSAGETVAVWGNTGDGFWELATGAVVATGAQMPGEFGSPRIVISCAQCSFGDSGSGVFDAQGRLLGILTKGWRRANGASLGIEVEPAALVLQEALATR
jgi:S1-C subfamily serine protease